MYREFHRKLCGIHVTEDSLIEEERTEVSGRLAMKDGDGKTPCEKSHCSDSAPYGKAENAPLLLFAEGRHRNNSGIRDRGAHLAIDKRGGLHNLQS